VVRCSHRLPARIRRRHGHVPWLPGACALCLEGRAPASPGSAVATARHRYAIHGGYSSPGVVSHVARRGSMDRLRARQPRWVAAALSSGTNPRTSAFRALSRNLAVVTKNHLYSPVISRTRGYSCVRLHTGRWSLQAV
jgi:hypothetical protein